MSWPSLIDIIDWREAKPLSFTQTLFSVVMRARETKNELKFHIQMLDGGFLGLFKMPLPFGLS